METTTTPQQEPVDVVDAFGRARPQAGSGAMRFPELVLAHYRYFVLHSRLVGSEGVLPAGYGPISVDGQESRNGERPSNESLREARHAYEQALRDFEAAEGTVQSAYWCVAVPSGVTLTVRKPRGLHALLRREGVMRLHRATDWITASYKDIQVLLHHCDILAIKAAGVLRGTAKQVALEWIFSEEQLLLAAAEMRAKVDPPRNGGKTAVANARRRKTAPDSEEDRHLAAILAEARHDIQRIETFYDRAANKAARITYFWGMVIGFAVALGLLALVALIVHASFYPVDLDDPARQNFFVAYAAGALGAVVSVLARMKREDGFTLDYEVGRSQSLRLGSFRPFIGAVFGLVVYFAIESDLLQLAVPDQNPATRASDASFYFLALLAFVAGFSERFTHVVIGGAERSLTGPLAREEDEGARPDGSEAGPPAARAPGTAAGTATTRRE